LTFNFLNASFVIFRAQTLENAWHIFAGMTGMHGLLLPERYESALSFLHQTGVEFGTVFEHINGKAQTLVFIVLAFIFVLKFQNSMQIMKAFKPTTLNLAFSLVLLITAVSMISRVSEFLYFNF